MAVQFLHRGAQTQQGAWGPFPACIPERLHRYWGHPGLLFLLTSLQKEQCQALCHRHQALCASEGRERVSKRFCGFSPALGPLPQSAFHSTGKKFGYLCFTDRIFSNLWSDGTGLGGPQQQQAMPFQYFCPSLGDFIEETTRKQCLCTWKRCGIARSWCAQFVGCVRKTINKYSDINSFRSSDTSRFWNFDL